MDFIRILGAKIQVEFLIGAGSAATLDHAQLLTGLQSMADLVNAKSWTDDQALAFQIMKKIVFFEGKIEVNGYEMERPCCDEDDAVFYWEANEFLKNLDADVHANTLFHDSWHVVQFRRKQSFAMTDDERVERELDAIDRQIEVAIRLGNSAAEIQFLIDFRNDQQRIKDRLAEGVDGRIVHAAEVGQG